MILLLKLFLSFAQAGTSCFPENNLQIPSFVEGVGITKDQYNSAIERISTEFGPDFKDFGGELFIKSAWEQGDVQASANRKGKYFEITIKGGFARFPGMTEDSLLLVFCHELGHHLGGAPRVLVYNGLTIEGQADYFATLKCARRLFTWVVDHNNYASTPKSLDSLCRVSFKDEKSVAICLRTLAASKVLAEISGEIVKSNIVPDIATPDHTVVSRLLTVHPNPQCRLDTFVAGTICPVQASLGLSDLDLDVGACSRWLGAKQGARPLCWYDEKQNFIYPYELKKYSHD